MLPKISLPTFDFEVPSTKAKIQYRPFVTKEQKVLLMALESNDDEAINNSVKQIINNCIVTPDFDIASLTSFDLEYLFLNLRAKSIGEKVTATFRCEHTFQGNTCNNVLKIEYNILDSKVVTNPEHSKKISLTETIGVVMKYPPLGMLWDNYRNKQDTENTINFMVQCIDLIWDGDTVYPAKEHTPEELIEFIESLPDDAFRKVEKFFETMPVVSQDLHSKCNKCGYDHTIVLEGLPSFFV